jgi:diguanylate cyclase (GGDEF)-like protein
MDLLFFKDTYRAFRSAFQKNCSSLDDMAKAISASIAPIAQALNIGLVKASLMNPADRNAYNANWTFFESPDGCSLAALIESFRTGDNGIFSLSVNPLSRHKFNEEEIRIIKVVAQDIFLQIERTLLTGLITKARATDTMTGIPNMGDLMQKGLNIKIAKKFSQYTGIFINLKNYKFINNTLGGIVGDQGIIMFARMAQDFVRGKGEIARLGGDNFFTFIQNEYVDTFIQKFSNVELSFSQRNVLHTFSIQTRMGICPAKQSDSMGDVMHGSSIALNIAKNEYGKDVVYYSPKMLESIMHEKKISATFQEAFKKHEFVVYYQPKVRIDSGELYGGEALVRWDLGDRIAPPAEFLPVLEKEASICQLDFYVFEMVCSDLRKWIDEGITPVRISSNFSKQHLKNKALANEILAVMSRYNIDSKYIEIELTEVSDFEDSVAMQDFVNKLREKGISVSIDDFGTGSSTLNALTNIDANIIKLDKSLLENMDKNNEQDKIVLKNMVNMMQELDKEVIAEGVETKSQLEFLKGINCPMVQGFFYDKPLPRSEFEMRLKERRVY